jgi:hypothetical protein
MRVFCPEHQKSFFAPRQSPIKCENRGHVLGELDFAGRGKSSFQFQWQYCCNCEHFCLINFDINGLQRCPVCTRRSSILYVCERCYTVSFESNTPLQTKNFSLTSEGVPSPCCPGCLQPPAADLREHVCEDGQVSFVTGLNTCPICDERLDVAPAFPSSIAQYLRRTKSANKLNVTFDYESELFVPIDDGEFVLISNSDDSGKLFVLPRSPRLASQRDFYELYQDYYHCVGPAAGEINIEEPAVVVPTLDGWKLLTVGVLSVVTDQRKVVPSETLAREEPFAPPAPPAPPTRPVRDEVEETHRCAQCNTPIETKYAFCWKCGHPRAEKSAPTAKARLVVPTFGAEDEEQTVQHEGRSRISPFQSWASAETRSRSFKQNGSMLKLFGIGAGGILLFSMALFAIWRPSSTAASDNQAAAPTEQTQPAPQPVEAKQAAETKPAPAPTTAAASAEDAALAQLRQMRIAAKPTDHSKIMKDLSEKERKFSDDYRFPYERARMTVLAHEKNFSEAAFAALSRAAQKAINKGKANEMLRNLNSDRAGDFQQLSKGHREWAQLQKALKKNDAAVLSENQGL